MNLGSILGSNRTVWALLGEFKQELHVQRCQGITINLGVGVACGYVGLFLILRRCMLKYIVVKCLTCSLRSNGSENIHK